MLSITDCIAFSGLTQDEIHAIAEHEHIPEIVAVELGNTLLSSPTGVFRICTMIRNDIDTAQAKGKYRHAANLEHTLTSFQARVGRAG